MYLHLVRHGFMVYGVQISVISWRAVLLVDETGGP
jgi:hypothetical protein